MTTTMIHRKQQAPPASGKAGAKTKSNSAATTRHTEETESENHKDHVKKSTRYTNGIVRALPITGRVVIVAAIGFAACTFIFWKTIYINLSPYTLTQCTTLLPVVIMFVRTAIDMKQSLASVGRKAHRDASSSFLVPAAWIAAVLAAPFPPAYGSAVGATGIVLFSLSTMPLLDNTNTTTMKTTNKSYSQNPVPVLIATLILVTVLLTENFLVWVVSATYPPGWQLTDQPLQDNGKIVIQYLLSHFTKFQVVKLRRLWNVQWSLVVSLGAAFALSYHPPQQQQQQQQERQQFYPLAARAVRTLAMARSIRTISFLWTVLPSPVKNCYRQRFPYPVPPLFSTEWILTGLRPASHGGCNDLIISGHATVTSTLACVVTHMTNDKIIQAAMWCMLLLDYAIEIYEGFHYSVDMWMGLVLVCLIWRVQQPLPQQQGTETTLLVFRKMSATTNAERLLYSFPAFMAFVQLHLLPEKTANAMILCFVISAAILFFRYDQHYAQHVLFCLLYMALGIYL